MAFSAKARRGVLKWVARCFSSRAHCTAGCVACVDGACCGGAARALFGACVRACGLVGRRDGGEPLLGVPGALPRSPRGSMDESCSDHSAQHSMPSSGQRQKLSLVPPRIRAVRDDRASRDEMRREEAAARALQAREEAAARSQAQRATSQDQQVRALLVVGGGMSHVVSAPVHPRVSRSQSNLS